MTELIDRMRTCAAFLLAAEYDIEQPGDDEATTIRRRAIRHAAELLSEASNILPAGEEAPSDGRLYADHSAGLGEPWSIIPPPTINDQTTRLWLKGREVRSSNACPRCDSRAGKKVNRVGRALMLTCPACSHEWQYQPQARWT